MKEYIFGMEKEQFSIMCTLLFIPVCILIGYVLYGIIYLINKIKK